MIFKDGEEVNEITIDGESVDRVTIDGEEAFWGYKPYINYTEQSILTQTTPEGEELWKLNLSDYDLSSPRAMGVAYYGDIYIYGFRGDLARINKDGEMVKQVSFSGTDSGRFMVIDYKNKRLYAGKGIGNPIYKLDYDFNPIWTYTGHGDLRVWSSTIDDNQNLYVSGSRSEDKGKVYKVSPTGSTVWSREIDNTEDGHNTYYRSMAVDENGNLYGGETGDGRLEKINSSGNLLWSIKFDENGDYDRSLRSMIIKDGYIYAGTRPRASVVKMDLNGNIIWQYETWQMTETYAYILALDINKHGEIIAGDQEGYVIKLDNNGNKIWDKLYEGSRTIFYSLFTPKHY